MPQTPHANQRFCQAFGRQPIRKASQSKRNEPQLRALPMKALDRNIDAPGTSDAICTFWQNPIVPNDFFHNCRTRLAAQTQRYILKRELGSGATSHGPICRRSRSTCGGGRQVGALAEQPKRPSATWPTRRCAPKRCFWANSTTHIVKVYDVVNDGEDHYVVMELVGSGSMERYARRSYLLEYPKAVDAVFKCAKALRYMNGLGLIHRDIKTGEHPADGARGRAPE